RFVTQLRKSCSFRIHQSSTLFRRAWMLECGRRIMVAIRCDNCQRNKAKGEDWLLAFNVRTSGLETVPHFVVVDLAGLELLRAEERVPKRRRSLGRSLVINNRWDERRILEEGAVHLCSFECKDEYLRKLAQRQTA